MILYYSLHEMPEKGEILGRCLVDGYDVSEMIAEIKTSGVYQIVALSDVMDDVKEIVETIDIEVE